MDEAGWTAVQPMIFISEFTPFPSSGNPAGYLPELDGCGP